MPVTMLLKKGINFNWTDKYKECFREVNDRLTYMPILTIFKVGKTIIVYTDALQEGYKYVLI